MDKYFWMAIGGIFGLPLLLMIIGGIFGEVPETVPTTPNQLVEKYEYEEDEDEDNEVVLVEEKADEINSCKLPGKIIGISDGDTVKVLDANKQQHKIRLAGIDTPERKQPYSKAAKKHLSKMIGKKDVCVQWYKLDKYQRKVGYIFVDSLDVNYEMVASGYAWHFKKYQSEQTPIDRQRYAEAETEAKLSVIGLWSEPDPIAPWDWRDGVRPLVPAPTTPKPINKEVKSSGFSCGSKRFCKHMSSCKEAYFYLEQCGLRRLDRDKDGIPCEKICGS